MNYRPFIGLVASILLVNVLVCDTAAVFAQSVRPPEPSSVGKKNKPFVDSAELLSGATKIEGPFTLYRTGSHLYAALSPQDFDRDFILLISIARGIAQRPLVGGHTWQFGNDWVCQFRRAGDQVHWVRRNVHYRAEPDSPAAAAVKLAYSDSILHSLPILAFGPAARHPAGRAAANTETVFVDLNTVFMNDLPGISQELSDYEFAADKSTWASVLGYDNNLELQVAATYTSKGQTVIETLPDSRALTVHMHYSLSKLPETNYRPRVADDRIGYFITALKDYSRSGDQDRFTRYINRWHLQKADPTLDVSPPQTPIVFWLEKTIPHQYRQSIRAGILEWNKAFDQIGYRNAIEVRQQPEDATWHPGDVRYNTFRWITSGIGVAAGPSRVNPLTGQILDADITFDADFLQIWKRKYETCTPEDIARVTGGPLDLRNYRLRQAARAGGVQSSQCGCGLMHSFSHQLALSATVMARRHYSPEELEEMTQQAVKKVAMHEVGHTLGLRHNFKGSSLYTVAQIQEFSLQKSDVSLSASVMDYLPANLAAPGRPQGNYYCSTIGPYDYWAIEYGYRPYPAGCSPSAETAQLTKIAARSGEPGHAYATDEDTRGIDADPHTGLFDYGNDLIEFAEAQAEIVAQSWPELVERVTPTGDGYQQARQAFGVLMITHGRAMFAASRYIGGIYSNRSHRGDAGAEPPQVVVAADKQRQALDLLSRRMFGDAAFDFPPELYRSLAITHWKHWGTERAERADFPVHESILLWQDRVLEKLLSPLTLTRLHDSERQIPADQDAFTVAELLERLTADIFAEIASLDKKTYTNRQPAISSHRRGLQAAYLERVVQLTKQQENTPSDCRAIALLELIRLQRRIEDLLRSDIKLDSYSLAHLTAAKLRISRSIDQQYTLVR